MKIKPRITFLKEHLKKLERCLQGYRPKRLFVLVWPNREKKSSGQSKNEKKMCSALIDKAANYYDLGQHDSGFCISKLTNFEHKCTTWFSTSIIRRNIFCLLKITWKLPYKSHEICRKLFIKGIKINLLNLSEKKIKQEAGGV